MTKQRIHQAAYFVSRFFEKFEHNCQGRCNRGSLRNYSGSVNVNGEFTKLKTENALDDDAG